MPVEVRRSTRSWWATAARPSVPTGLGSTSRAPDTGLPGRRALGFYDNSMWDEQRAFRELESPGARRRCLYWRTRRQSQPLSALFGQRIFNLRIDDDTIRRRLEERTNNDYGKQREEVELMLRLNRSDEKPAGAIDADATQPLDQIVDELLRLANCKTVTSNSTLTPWSKRRYAIGQSFVISESRTPQ